MPRREFEWDPAKDAANLRKHGASFELAAKIDWDTALEIPDTRYDYGESRFWVIGYIEARLHILTMTPRGLNIRVISLRKANAKEEKFYGEATR